MNEKIISFTTYGPNRGKTVTLGNYHFEDGICHIKESDAAKAASILHNYHDICYEHELEAKAAEFDKVQGIAKEPDNPPAITPENEKETPLDDTEPPADSGTKPGNPEEEGKSEAVEPPADETPSEPINNGRTTSKKQVNHDGKGK